MVVAVEQKYEGNAKSRRYELLNLPNVSRL